MIGVVIATHADFAKGIMSAIELILGKQKNVKMIGLYHGDNIDYLEAKIAKAITEVDEGDGTIVLIDFLGGSPANVTSRLLKSKDFACLTGVNMPMLMEAFSMRSHCKNIEMLKTSCQKAALEGIIDLGKLISQQNNKPIDNDDF